MADNYVSGEEEDSKVGGVQRRGVGVRRPMNAFLIFCKHNRAEVKRQYPQLENRAVTKILGEWWADLTSQQKATYTDLANKYKEAYMKAHPEFRWYNKMPAVTSSSRGMSTRTKPAKLLVANDPNQQQQIIPGKLADESQLGGLSMLLSQASTKPANAFNQAVPKPPKKRYLEENYVDQNGPHRNRYNTSESSGSSSPVENRELPPLTNGKSTFEEDRKDAAEEEDEEDKGTTEEGEEKTRLRIWRKHLLVNESGETTEERGQTKEEAEQEVNNNEQASGERRGRACKGQRYKEFINTLQATLPRKKSKWETNDDLPEDRVQTRRKGEKPVETKKIKEEPLDYQETSSDFNLDEKIHALPLLNIEEFQIKKKAKKKSGGAGKKEETFSTVQTRDVSMHDLKVQLETQNNNNNNNIVNEDSTTLILCGLDCAIGGDEKKDEEKCVVVGSRKRKARRQGIRRLQPGTSFKDTSVVEVANGDTHGLETLADVAAKKQKLVK